MTVGVRCQGDAERWVCVVDVDHAGEQTRHTVTVTAADLDRWAPGRTEQDAEDLVARSFAFLLEREPPGSILERFNLAVIQSYFPEYEGEFGRRID